MSDSETLKKAIEIAMKNGWDKICGTEYRRDHITTEHCYGYTQIRLRGGYYISANDILFDHSFRKALVGENVIDEDIVGCVASTDRIKYLEGVLHSIKKND